MSLPTSIHPFLITGNDANQYKIANSLRFRQSNSAYLSRTPSSSGNLQKWTVSVWLKRAGLSSRQNIFGGGSGSYDVNELNASNQLSGGSNYPGGYTTSAYWRDPSAWAHWVFRWDSANADQTLRWRVYVNNSLQTLSWSSGYPTQNASTSWNSTNPQGIGGFIYSGTLYCDLYMAEFYNIDGQSLDPSSFGQTDPLTNQWVPKRYTGTYGTNGFYLPFNDATSTTQNLLPYSEQFNQASYWGGSNISYTSNSVAAPNGDTAADTCAATATGSSYGNALTNITFSAGQTYTFSMYAKAGTASCFGLHIQPSYPDRISAQYNLSTGTFIGGIVPGGTTSTFVTGGMQFVGNGWYRCWLTATTAAGTGLVYFGPLNTITTPSTDPFNNTIGNSVYVWGAQLQAGAVPGPYTLTTTSAISTAELSIGADNSYGLSSWNNWRSSGISVTSGVTYDVMRDSPTAYDDGGTGRGNYPVLNPIDSGGANSLVWGNLYFLTQTGVGNMITKNSTLWATSGKWYFEVTVSNGSATSVMNTGAAGLMAYDPASTSPTRGGGVGYGSNDFMWRYDGYKVTSGTATAYGTAVNGNNDVVMIAYDHEGGKIWFGKNGSWFASGNPAAGTNASFDLGYAELRFKPSIQSIHGGGGTATNLVNFGQQPFAYTPPTGFKALNSYNLSNPSLPLV